MLAAHLEPPLQLRLEAPLDQGHANEPEPDLAFVACRDDAYWSAHPTAAETALVIELADTSLPLIWWRRRGSTAMPGFPVIR